MATEKKTSQSQKNLDIWNQLVDQQLKQLNASYEQMTAVQKMGMDYSTASVETTSKFVRDSLDFAGKISTEWTQMGLEANRKALETMRNGFDA